MGPTLEGSADAHRGRVRIIAVATLALFAVSLLTAGAAIAKPKSEAELLAQTIDFSLPARGTVGDVVELEGSASSGLPF